LQLLELELLAKNVVDAPILSSIDAASREIQRLSSLVGKFRKFARGQIFKLRPCDLVALIRDAVAPEKSRSQPRVLLSNLSLASFRLSWLIP
jgi:nitrogen fixation/metabolism regulation signal transduction histidine kinase